MGPVEIKIYDEYLYKVTVASNIVSGTVRRMGGASIFLADTEIQSEADEQSSSRLNFKKLLLLKIKVLYSVVVFYFIIIVGVKKKKGCSLRMKKKA